jgi:hypothetical protein
MGAERDGRGLVARTQFSQPLRSRSAGQAGKSGRFLDCPEATIRIISSSECPDNCMVSQQANEGSISAALENCKVRHRRAWVLSLSGCPGSLTYRTDWRVFACRIGPFERRDRILMNQFRSHDRPPNSLPTLPEQAPDPRLSLDTVYAPATVRSSHTGIGIRSRGTGSQGTRHHVTARPDDVTHERDEPAAAVARRLRVREAIKVVTMVPSRI